MIKKFYRFAKNELFPLNRSITGKGTPKTLQLIRNQLGELKINKILLNRKNTLKVYNLLKSKNLIE